MELMSTIRGNVRPSHPVTLGNSPASNDVNLDQIAHQDGLQVSIATEADRETIYQMRHEVYALELGQHPANAEGTLTDNCDRNNLYLVARRGHHIAAFVSLTLPGGTYSIDKYLRREDFPFTVTDTLYEARLLTVQRQFRRSSAAKMLMYAALRMIEHRGGTHVIALGRRALKPLYEKAGLRFLGVPIRSGSVDYELMTGTTDSLRTQLSSRMSSLRRLRRRCAWNLPIPFELKAPCAHGGASFGAIGNAFDTLERRHEVVTADVLDAWFPPAPGAINALLEHLPWLLRTSPPADGDGLIQAIAAVRGVPTESLALGAGSSALIYLALRQWLSPNSRVLLPDPTYGEYAHVLEQVVNCKLDRLPVHAADDYQLNPVRILDRLRRASERGTPYDMVVLVNPNNPTGQHLARTELENILADVPPQTLVWLDEAYVDYIGAEQSLENWAARSQNIIVCKSLSKGLALSGARAAYLCGPAALMREMRFLSPPWAVSLPAQVAAVAALGDPEYYLARYAKTRVLREQLANQLHEALPDLEIYAGLANWLLCRLPSIGPSAAIVCARCQIDDVFLRDAGLMSRRIGSHTIRIAVKDEVTNRRIVAALVSAIATP